MTDYDKLMNIVASQREVYETVNLHVSVAKIDEEQQIVTGEVYAPLIIDTHGDMMEPEDVELLAHRFMADAKNDHIDIMHNNKPALAVAVESYIALPDNEDFSEGAWVLSTKIHDTDLWEDIKSGVLNGYSMEILVRKVPALVELEIQNHVFGIVEINEDHDHVFFVEVNDDGKVIGGRTSLDNDHFHEIRFGTATEMEEDHSHRYFLM